MNKYPKTVTPLVTTSSGCPLYAMKSTKLYTKARKQSKP